ncbi:hypothetical protein [Sinosporangium siamense]|uniref:Uncharacterized protein n=1 Tax=Sinosporangium siamense TaxID=1367973 RepID=A0A919VAG6_9ACTN|nr:hypothetical protein [Sinosporangium siamense]GII96451.1 hypothetical protein Ssi02_66820 [Sinosporangium siamense]
MLSEGQLDSFVFAQEDEEVLRAQRQKLIARVYEPFRLYLG